MAYEVLIFMTEQLPGDSLHKPQPNGLHAVATLCSLVIHRR